MYPQRLEFKKSDSKSQEFMPDSYDEEVGDMIKGLALWGIKASPIQVAGWPWVIVPADQQIGMGRLVALWNIYQKSRKKPQWAGFFYDFDYIIAHPLRWEDTQELLATGSEFGKFIAGLPFDALTREGFESIKRKYKTPLARTHDFLEQGTRIFTREILSRT